MRFRRWISIVILLIAILAISIALYFVFDAGITADGRIQYIGAIIGGLATMLGVVVTINEDRSQHEAEYRPQIRLTLSDYYYHGNFFCAFATKFADGKPVADHLNVFPLKIENIGRSDVTILEVCIGKEGIIKDQWAKYTYRTDTANERVGKFGIYSQEAQDIPLKVELGNQEMSFQVVIKYQKDGETKDHIKKYSVYAPKGKAEDEDSYREWTKKINITKLMGELDS